MVTAWQEQLRQLYPDKLSQQSRNQCERTGTFRESTFPEALTRARFPQGHVAHGESLRCRAGFHRCTLNIRSSGHQVTRHLTPLENGRVIDCI